MKKQRRDIRYDPQYPLAHAAQYLGMNVHTLRTWVKGRHYPVSGGKNYFAPLINLPKSQSSELSFINLVEAHVLCSMRIRHGIRMDKARRAINYVAKELHTDHPMAEESFQTDGIRLYIERFNQLMEARAGGQFEEKKFIKVYLQRIERDTQGLAKRLYPFSMDGIKSGKIILIDPFVSFGRPTLTGTGISTAIIAERWNAGDSLSVLAEDYGLKERQLEEAVWYERAERKAA